MRQAMRTSGRLLAVVVLTSAVIFGGAPTVTASPVKTDERASTVNAARQAVQVAPPKPPAEHCENVIRTIRGQPREVRECLSVIRITKESDLPSMESRKKMRDNLVTRMREQNPGVTLADTCTPVAPPGIYSVSRIHVCSVSAWVVVKFRVIGRIRIVVGRIKVFNIQTILTDTRANSWSHSMSIQVFDGECDWASGIPLRLLNSLCDGSALCKVIQRSHPANTPIFLANGSTEEFSWTEDLTSDALPPDGVAVLNGTLGFRLAPADAPLLEPDDGIDSGSLRGERGVLTVRCDSIARSGTTGCVNQSFTPTMQVALSQGGASAAMIAWAQQNLSGAWGVEIRNSPLHRLADDDEADENRQVLCGEDVFTKDPFLDAALAPYNDRDSCDEFPFAHTYESGANPTDHEGNPRDAVESGDECAQVKAVQTGTSNDPAKLAADFAAAVPQRTPRGDELCVRGHIPLKLNQSVGGSYSAFIQDQRLLDRDAFWLEVVP